MVAQLAVHSALTRKAVGSWPTHPTITTQRITLPSVQRTTTPWTAPHAMFSSWSLHLEEVDGRRGPFSQNREVTRGKASGPRKQVRRQKRYNVDDPQSHHVLPRQITPCSVSSVGFRAVPYEGKGRRFESSTERHAENNPQWRGDMNKYKRTGSTLVGRW